MNSPPSFFSTPAYISYFWIITNFLEHVALLSYLYVVFINGKVNDNIKLEFIAFAILWIVFPNTLRIFDLCKVNISDFAICIICLIFLYCCLFVNGYLPIYYSFSSKQDVKYTFNSKLVDNFFLFLSNEDCVLSFLNYINEVKDEKAIYYLRIYTDIMKLKMKYQLVDNTELLDISKNIFNNYFNLASSQYFSDETVSKIKAHTEQLYSDDVNLEIFDPGLVVAYEYLFGVFKRFKETVDYKILIDNLNLVTYIQCKMCNTGLINPI